MTGARAFLPQFRNAQPTNRRIPVVQTKLEVNQPGDRYEQEADRIADAVMASRSAPAPVTPVYGAVLQSCACGGTCAKCREEREEKGRLQRTPDASPETSGTAEAPGIVDDVLRGGGRPLDAGTRRVMEARLGHDFGGVRVHDDAAAASSAAAVRALAYTVGEHVVFGSGRYAPHHDTGRRLLAHELVHVAQQGHAAALAHAPRLVQRQPAASLRDQICYRPQSAPARTAETCDTREPENCATYEQWIVSFGRLRSFQARDTAPGGTEESQFDVIGERAARPVEPAPTGQGATLPPAPAVRPQTADRFIDHPTDRWVQTCLPPNLRETAYRLPADCADVAVILRHVWLSAHGRTESYGNWVVGDAAGRARQREIGQVISSAYSGNVQAMLNPYSDANGRPLRTFAALRDLLHPGDVLVWEHHSGGLGTRRTGGDTETIRNVARSGSTVTHIDVIQGNQPIFEEQAEEIRANIGRGAPPEAVLREAPGRRIEVHRLTSPGDLRDLPLPPRSSRAAAAPPTVLWTLDDGHTTLVAAGPPRAARRPAARSIQGRRVRRVSDWLAPIRAANRASLTGVLEAALLELRSFIEGGQTGLDADALELAEAAGERLWLLARQARDMGEESHFRPLRRMRALIQGIGNPGALPGAPASRTPRAAAVRALFERMDAAFDAAARGATTVSFTRRVPRGAALVNVLVTGFDPFAVGGPVPVGTVNPSGAAALALDAQIVNAGGGVRAAVEGIVLPVSFADFRRGMVERIVRPLVQSRTVDSILTVSLDESIAPTGPVQIERFVVGVHNEHLPGSRTEAIPAAPQAGIGPAIIETPAAVEDVARETELRRRGGTSVPRPAIGNAVTFRFPSVTMSSSAQRALGLLPNNAREVTIGDLGALRRITASMRRLPNGIDIEFDVGTQRFRATVLRGPGGDFLSNEVSYRVLRLLAQEGRQDIASFHVHVPRATANEGDVIPQDTSTRAARTLRQRATSFALGVRDRIVATLRRMIAAVARRIAAARSGTSTRPGGAP